MHLAARSTLSPLTPCPRAQAARSEFDEEMLAHKVRFLGSRGVVV